MYSLLNGTQNTVGGRCSPPGSDIAPNVHVTHFQKKKSSEGKKKKASLERSVERCGAAVPQLYTALKLRPADEKDAHGQCGQSPPIGSAATALWDQKIHF